MPSSTSSFSRSVPSGRWGLSLLIALVLATGFLTGWELHWRHRGYAPTLNDTGDLWAARRTELAHGNPERTVIVGSSRIQFDFDLATYRDYFGAELPIQLALPGSCPLPVLEHLAGDRSFRGTVLCGVVPGLFFVPEGFPVERSRDAIHRYENWSPSQRSGNALGILLQQRLAFIQEEDLTLEALLASLRIPNRPAVQTGPEFPPYFQRIDTHRQASMWERLTFDSPLAIRIQNIWIPLFTPPPPPPGVTEEQARERYAANVETYLERTRVAVETIRSRGGRVVFIRCPSTDRLREMENQFSPRAGFWDRILIATGAPGIHFEDYPELAGFRCPEWSHLTAEDSRIYTRNLMPILETALEKAGSAPS